jgi:hypothetical protein
MRFSRHPVKDTGLLRMTERVEEIATSHRTLLAMTEQEKIQIPPSSPFAKGGDSFLYKQFSFSSDAVVRHGCLS